MAFQALADGVRAVLIWGSAGIEWTNTLYFTRSGFTLAEQEIFADLVMDQFEDLAAIYLSSDFQIKNVAVYDMRSEVAPVVYSNRTPVTGGVVGSAGAISSGLVVTFYTAQRGRSGRGRNYLAGFAEVDMGARIVEDAVMITNINTFYAGIIPNWATNGWTWVVASGQQGGVPLASLEAYPVSSAVVRNNLYGTQRRRVPRS